MIQGQICRKYSCIALAAQTMMRCFTACSTETAHSVFTRTFARQVPAVMKREATRIAQIPLKARAVLAYILVVLVVNISLAAIPCYHLDSPQSGDEGGHNGASGLGSDPAWRTC